MEDQLKALIEELNGLELPERVEAINRIKEELKKI